MKKGYLLDDRPFSFDRISNEISMDFFEDLIKENEYYTEERMKSFYKRDTIQLFRESVIDKPQKNMLDDIHKKFIAQNTEYKIIISPLYDQKKLSNNDLYYLKSLFGDKFVFDFSGINPYTNDYKNYYEKDHYRPRIASELMEQIYDSNSSKKGKSTLYKDLE